MKTIIVPEPFSASSFSISVKEAPRSEEGSCLNGQKTPKRGSRQRRKVSRHSVTDALIEATHDQFGSDDAHWAQVCEAAGSSEPTGVLESSLLKQRLARRLQPAAFAPPADEFTSVCGWFEFQLALYEENSVGGR
jgi:hypothetical protein